MQRRRILGTLGLTTVAALLAAIGLAAAPASAEPTIVSAVDFEDGSLGPWGPRGGVTLSVTDAEAHGGSRSLSVANRTANWQGVSVNSAGLLQSGGTYAFSAWVKLPAGTSGTSGIHFTAEQTPAAGGGSNTYTWVGSPVDVSATGWVQVGGTWAFPADVSSANVYLEAAAIGDANPSFLVDDLTITTEDGGTVPDPGGEVVLETGFEDGLDGWALRGGSASTTATVERSTAQAHDGGGSAVVTGRTSQGDGIGHDVTGLLDPAVTYELTAWLRFGDGQPVDDVWLSRANTEGGTTAFATIAQFDGVTNDGWTQVTATFQGSDAAASLLYFETRWDNGAAGNTSDLYVDDVVLRVPAPPVVEDLEGIKETVDFPVGVAIDSRETAGAASELLLRHFDQVTPENFMKPEAWYDADGHFVTANAESDALMDFAQANDLGVYGHVLVWHGQTPAWFFQDAAGQPLTTSDADKQVLRERLRTHVFDVAGYLADRYGPFGSDTNPLRAIDVVNEVVSDGGEYADGLRRSEWYRILGEEFIDLAFAAADEAFNDVYAAEGAEHPVTLFINDYNTEQGGKQQRYHALVSRLVARGVPVDGVGHQFHVSLAMPVSALEDAIEAFEDLPVTQAVTEFDVTTGTPVTQAKLVDQGYYFRDAFRAFREHADDLFSVTVWGLTDGRSWRVDSGAPLVFDDALKAKPAYFGAVDGALPAPLRTANVFGGDVALDASAAASPEWARLPLHDVDGTARFQLRWAPDHLTAFVSVDDATTDAADAVEFTVGDATHAVARDGSGDVDAVVTERDGGYDLVAHLPVADAAEGSTLGFDVRVTDGAAAAGPSGWNSPGVLGTLTLVEPLSYIEVVEASEAPTVDGVADDGWAAANAVTTSKQVQGVDGAVANVRTLWKGDTLYVLAEVADPVVDVSGSDPWIQDSVEFYVDPGNAKNGSYRYDDSQIRISAANAVSFGTGDEAFQRARVQSATALVDGGYVVEASVDLGDFAGEGTFQGLDFQVNDASGGQRTAIRNWADPTGAGYQSTARWGVARFVAPAAPTAATNLVAPTITGTAAVGRTLTAEPGEWDLQGLDFAYQWRLDGVDLPRATSATYRVKRSDAGGELTVVVTATGAGLDPATATSEPARVLAESTTRLDLSRHLGFTSQSTTATVRVTSTESVAGGTVQLIVDGRTVGAPVAVDAKGRATIALPKLGAGIHLVRAAFGGTGAVAPSTSGIDVLVLLF